MILKVHQHILESTDPWWTICILHSSTDHHVATQKQYHLAQVEHVNASLDSFHNGSNCFGVSVDLKCKIYDLGPLQDCYPARRRPHNSVTVIPLPKCNSVTKFPTKRENTHYN